MNDGREPLSVSTLEVAGRIRKEISANRAEVQIPDFTLADVVVGLVLIAVKLFLEAPDGNAILEHLSLD